MDAFTMPWPPTVNTYWRRVGPKTLISAAGRRYRRTIKQLALLERWPRLGGARVAVHITAIPPDKRFRDLDNILKATLDALDHAGVYDDDSQVDMLTVRRDLPDPRNGRLMVRIMEEPE